MRAIILSAILATVSPGWVLAHTLPTPQAVDAEVRQAMTRTGARGLAIAVINDGKVAYVQAYGVRNAQGEPLTVDTVMYGASLTKTVFGYLVMQQVDKGKMALDTSIADYLPQPLPAYHTPDIVNRYADWSALDERWRKLTPRILLNHGSGFSNFGFLEPDEKLKFHFDPGTRYAYSGDGLITLQFVMETGLSVDVGQAADAVFLKLGMKRTSLIWRADFATNLADGWDENGKVEPHDERSKVRAAGSMDTTISDFSKFAAAYVRGDGLTPAGRAELVRPQLPITTRSQFPSLQAELPVDQRRKDLAAGLGVVVFDGPQGRGFMKGGHNDTTANTWVCIEKSKRCVVILSNDVRSEKAFAGLVTLVLGDTGVPYDWEYGFTPVQ
ncbi:serine hydrolase [Asticcacaulis sp. BYS171W]|uniref:Serine hydrolase n=1 Tax=Asticcacaulis aquaticus TaxID=2984212 RepID=A0ABT5HQ28_9CAUL|nr:serine hydrolase domain-containing protein [Asticcacaulis aquaticus]MDC7682058.1 serine hydrolase [Asticcacaulis aquaticus]